jgi:ubiquinone/menaquinone biosynthesis C-methylase UbiE
MEFGMPQIMGLADTQYVTSQYQNATNLNTRMQLHRRFSTNKYGWHRWVFDNLDFPPQGRILELGCGSGDLWFENIDRIPTEWNITLSDFSAGMLQQAQQNLDRRRSFQFELIDAQSIPFRNRSFDGVIANHMLYHLPDIAKSLSEVRRVLKPDGSFYTSTNGQRHLQEMADMVSRFDSRLAWWGAEPSDSFVLENGAAQLTPWFTNVTLHRYKDSLIVTEPAPLVEYILSGRIELTADRQLDFANFVRQEFQRRGGKFHVTKDPGIFISHGTLQA